MTHILAAAALALGLTAFILAVGLWNDLVNRWMNQEHK